VSSKRERRLRSCQNKVRHPTKEKAEEALQSMFDTVDRDDHNHDMETLEVYECWYCLGYHIGHNRNVLRNKLKRGG